MSLCGVARVVAGCEDDSGSGPAFDASTPDVRTGPFDASRDVTSSDVESDVVDAGPDTSFVCGFQNVDGGSLPIMIFHFDEGMGTTTISTPHADAATTTTATLTSATWATGCSTALSFDGTSSVAVAPDEPDLNFPGGEITVSAWVKVDPFPPDASSQSLPVVSKVGTGNVGWALGVTRPSGIPFFRVTTAGNLVQILHTTFNLADGEWHHLAGSYAADGNRIYVDGVGTGPGSTLAMSLVNSGNLEIGRYTPLVDGGTTSYFQGLIDELRIYPAQVRPVP
jgi:hypothetical protein